MEEVIAAIAGNRVVEDRAGIGIGTGRTDEVLRIGRQDRLDMGKLGRRRRVRPVHEGLGENIGLAEDAVHQTGIVPQVETGDREFGRSRTSEGKAVDRAADNMHVLAGIGIGRDIRPPIGKVGAAERDLVAVGQRIDILGGRIRPELDTARQVAGHFRIGRVEIVVPVDATILAGQNRIGIDGDHAARGDARIGLLRCIDDIDLEGFFLGYAVCIRRPDRDGMLAERFIIQLAIDRQIIANLIADRTGGDGKQPAGIVGQFGGDGRERAVECLDVTDLGPGLGIFGNAQVGFAGRRGRKLERIVGRLDRDRLLGGIAVRIGHVHDQVVNAVDRIGSLEVEHIGEDDADIAVGIGLERKVAAVVTLATRKAIGQCSTFGIGGRKRADHRADAGGFRNGRVGKCNVGGSFVDIVYADRKTVKIRYVTNVRHPNLDADFLHGFIIERTVDHELVRARRPGYSHNLEITLIGYNNWIEGAQAIRIRDRYRCDDRTDRRVLLNLQGPWIDCDS